MHRHSHHHAHAHAHYTGGAAAPSRSELPLAEHPTLELETDFAFIAVEPIGEGEAPSCDVSGIGENAHAHVTTDKGVTRVRVEGLAHAIEDGISRRGWGHSFWSRGRFHGRFPTHITLRVPANVRAKIRATGARVQIERLAGCDLTVAVDAGALELDDVSGRLVLSTDAGRIEGRRISGSLEATTSMGEIRLDVLSLDPGEHRVRTNMGAARIELARGMPVQIDTRTAMGTARVDYASVKGAPSVLSLEADVGGIRVGTSRHVWSPSRATKASTPVNAGPYRTANEPENTPENTRIRARSDEDLNKILNEVADGKVSPGDARELLRAMGWS